jgi:hypothetical protein
MLNLMIIKNSLVLLGVCGALTAALTAAETAKKSAPALPPTTPATSAAHVQKSAPASAEKAKPAAPQASPGATASARMDATRELEEANEKHILPAHTLIAMETPPPSPRAEKKPPLPTPGLVWMPGHWTPVKGEWQWTPGEWGIPATPVSVWIEPRYDAKTKHWRPGYWQPDRAAPYEPERSQDDHTPTPKFL